MTGPRPPNRPRAVPGKRVVEAATEGLTPRAWGPQAACPESSTKPVRLSPSEPPTGQPVSVPALQTGNPSMRG